MIDNILNGCKSLGATTYSVDTPGGVKSGLTETQYNQYKQAIAAYNTAFGDAMKNNKSKPVWSDFEKQYVTSTTTASSSRSGSSTSARSTTTTTPSSTTTTTQTVFYTLDTPGGTKTNLTRAEYEKYKELIVKYNQAYQLAYTYNLPQPIWAEFEKGLADLTIDMLQKLAEQKKNGSSTTSNNTSGSYSSASSSTSSSSTSSTGNGWSIDTPGGTLNNLTKPQFDTIQQYVKQYNEAYNLAYSNNLPKPNWADFANGNGADVIAEYESEIKAKQTQRAINEILPPEPTPPEPTPPEPTPTTNAQSQLQEELPKMVSSGGPGNGNGNGNGNENSNSGNALWWILGIVVVGGISIYAFSGKKKKRR